MLSSNITANKFAQIIFSIVLIRNARPLHLRAVEGGRGSWVPLIGRASLATSLQVGRNKFTAKACHVDFESSKSKWETFAPDMLSSLIVYITPC